MLESLLGMSISLTTTLLFIISTLALVKQLTMFVLSYNVATKTERSLYVAVGIEAVVILLMSIFILHTISNVPDSDFVSTIFASFYVWALVSIRIYEKTASILHGGISDMFLVLAGIFSIVALVHITS